MEDEFGAEQELERVDVYVVRGGCGCGCGRSASSEEEAWEGAGLLCRVSTVRVYMLYYVILYGIYTDSLWLTFVG